MNSSAEDRFARRIVMRLGREPELDDAVAQRLAHARRRALAIAAAKHQPAVLSSGNSVALGGRRTPGWRGWVLLASGLALAAMLSSAPHREPEHSYGWDASVDDGRYVELLH